MRTEGRTDGQTDEANNRFTQFYEGAYKCVDLYFHSHHTPSWLVP
jgi:hypothetical protein